MASGTTRPAEAAGGDADAPEWADYSNASAAETFVAALEMLTAQWGLSETLPAAPPSPPPPPRARRTRDGRRRAADASARASRPAAAGGKDDDDDDNEDEEDDDDDDEDDDDEDADDDVDDGDANRADEDDEDDDDSDDDSSDNLDTHRSEELPLGKDRFSVLYVPHPDGVYARVPVSPVEARLSLAEIMLLTKCASFAALDQPYAIEQLFGVTEYVVLSPTQRRANMNDVALLLSSASLALPTCARPVPCFVPVARGALEAAAKHSDGTKGRRFALRRRLQGALARLLPHLQSSTVSYFGTWTASADSSPGTVIHFNSVEQRIADVPKSLRSLGGICKLFRGKLGRTQPRSAASSPSPNNNSAATTVAAAAAAAAAATAAGLVVGADVEVSSDVQDSSSETGSSGASSTSSSDSHPAPALHPDTLLAQGHILVSVRYSYEGRRIWNPALLTLPTPDAQTRATNWTEWHDSDLGWRLHIDHFGKPAPIVALRGGLGRPPLWGPLSDPIASVNLQVIWPPFVDHDATDNEMLSTLIPERAPVWVVEASLDRLASSESFGAGPASPSDHDDNNSDYDVDAVESEASCPLAWSVRFLQKLVEASLKNRYHASMLSRLPQGLEGSDADDDDDDFESEARVFGDFDMHLRSESGVAQPGGPMQAPPRAGRGARNLSFENERVRALIKDLFTASHEEELPRTVLEQLKRLKELYMSGALTNHEFKDAKERVLAEAGRAGPDASGDRSASVSSTSRSASPFNVLERPCPECWLCAPGSNVRLSRQHKSTSPAYKGAPEGSLLSILALRVIPEFGASMSAVSALWRGFVAELRWYWDNAVLIPINQCLQEGAEPVDHADCLLHQKIVLLNICIASRAHHQFEHEKAAADLAARPDHDEGLSSDSRQGNDQKSSRAGGDGEDAEGLEEGSDTFWDAESTGPGSPTYVRTVAGMNVPWTIENSLMTEDMARERTELMGSLAIKQSTAELHRDMLSRSLRSEIAAFKAANPKAAFEDFKRFKGRARMLGDFWRKLWDETAGATLREQVAGDPGLFSFEAEAEKLLHYFETMPPYEALEDLFVVGLQSAVYVLRSAVDSFEDYPEIHALLDRNLQSASMQLLRLDARRHGPDSPASPARRGRAVAEEAKLQRAIRQCALDGLERTELLLGLAASLLHKFPASVAESMLAENEVTGRLVATLETEAATERQHVRSLLFPESVVDSLAMPAADRREFVLRALARRGSFRGATWVRPGANRMFVSMTHSSFTLATSLTETSFA